MWIAQATSSLGMSHAKGETTMPTAVEQLIELLKKDIASFEAHAKRAEEMLPHLSDKYKDRWKAAIDSRWQHAKELSALLQEIQRDHPGN
jgi:ubiquinone biosynthesis protein COQ9